MNFSTETTILIIFVSHHRCDCHQWYQSCDNKSITLQMVFMVERTQFVLVWRCTKHFSFLFSSSCIFPLVAFFYFLQYCSTFAKSTCFFQVMSTYMRAIPLRMSQWKKYTRFFCSNSSTGCYLFAGSFRKTLLWIYTHSR